MGSFVIRCPITMPAVVHSTLLFPRHGRPPSTGTSALSIGRRTSPCEGTGQKHAVRPDVTRPRGPAASQTVPVGNSSRALTKPVARKLQFSGSYVRGGQAGSAQDGARDYTPLPQCALLDCEWRRRRWQVLHCRLELRKRLGHFGTTRTTISFSPVLSACPNWYEESAAAYAPNSS